ncbi:hypothetical protein O984_03770 [Mycobacterium avium 05-4293]|nr:hypothetical protein O984_03770 [Mycobacterium avium 05-4293]
MHVGILYLSVRQLLEHHADIGRGGLPVHHTGVEGVGRHRREQCVVG